MLAPSATVFFSSGCIMILELVASRLVARDLGSSLYTWTSIIGVVLAGISVGNYFGGRIADRRHARRSLAVLFGLSSAACVAIVVVNNLIGQWTWLWQLNWPLHVFLHVSLVFFLPSMLLGMIGPVVAKMALDQGLATGRTVGDIYAWGAAGSIAGTFLAGFFLIATFGTVTIVWSVGAAMLVVAILYWASCWGLHLWGAAFAALATMGMAPADWAMDVGVAAHLREAPDPSVIYEDETPYCHVAVRRVSERPDRRAFMQDKLKHSEIVMGNVTDLQYFYTRIYAGLTHGLGKTRDDLSMLVIGGGGYVFPQHLQASWPESRVEVVEIDPGVTEAAMEAFGLPRDTTIRTITMDARNYVDQLLRRSTAGIRKRYDFIYEDAINDYSVPFQLVTREFNEKISLLLAEDGLYMVNLIDTYENGQFLGAVVNTLAQTFPHVRVITNRANLPSLRNTFVVVAAKQPFEARKLLADYDPHLRFWLLDEAEVERLVEKCDGVVLTDDYAPVENMLAPVVRQSAREILARRYLQEAQELQASERYIASIAKYRRALELNPSMSIKAYNEIGMMQVASGNQEEAAVAFARAIQYHTEAGTEEAAIASVHMNLGLLLGQMGKPQKSREQLAQAVKWFRIELEGNPRAVVAWDRLGDTLATLGDLKGASEAFEKAVALEPGNPAHYAKLAKALEFQQRYDEALEVARRHMQLMQTNGQPDAAAQLRQYIEILEYKNVKRSP
jgi:predicted membrane-bound spermidine synthase/Tfp pilus assembly protein PilF